MIRASGKKVAYSVPPSKYWAQNWNSCRIGSVATFQLIMIFVIVGMEIGNALVDIYKANVYSGFWSFPFTISAAVATYACVCTKKTQTKAIVALILQSIAIFVLLIVIGFLIAFMSNNFTLCLGFQCNQTSTTFISTSNTAYFAFSSTTYNILKRVFIICEFGCSVIFIIFSIIYIVLFIKCWKKLPHVHPIIRNPRIQTAVSSRLTPTVTQSSQPIAMSGRSLSERIHTSTAEKVCPNCGHVSPYIPSEDTVECPKCSYQSILVEHAQEW